MKNGSLNPKLLAVLGLLVVLAGYFMLVRPQGARLADARIERADAEAQLALGRQQAAAPPTTAAGGGPGPAAVAVPLDPAIPTLLRQLEAIARETGLRYTTVTPSPVAAVAGAPGGSIQLTIGASGPRVGAYAYLNRLANLPRLIVVEQVSLNKGTQAGAAGAGGSSPTAAAGGEVSLQLTARAFTTETPPATPPS